MYKYILFCLLHFGTITQAQLNTNQNGQGMPTAAGTLDNATVFTVEFWVKTNEDRRNDIYWQRPYLFGNETNGDNSGDFGITTNNGYIGMWEGLSDLNTDQQFLSSSIRLNDNSWHHIAAVNNGQTLNLYVDGNIVGSLISGRSLLTNSAPLTFGAASLDHDFPGNDNNTNFYSPASFGDARISTTARYSANFIPVNSFTEDANTIVVYHFNDQNNNAYSNNSDQQLYPDPNRPVTFDPGEPINDSYARPARLYINDSVALNGRLLLGKKNWSLSSEIGVHFFEGDSKKDNYYKPEEIIGFKIGDSYYEPKFLGPGGAINTQLTKTIVKRLTPAGSRIAMFEYESRATTKSPNGHTEFKRTIIYFVQLPGVTDDRVYQFSDNKFTPHFDTRVSTLVQDMPALADKIRNKDKDFFYALVTDDKHQLLVWWNIINEYNRQ